MAEQHRQRHSSNLGPTPPGKELFELCREIIEDGSVSLEEVKRLRRSLHQHRDSNSPTVLNLSRVVERIVADRIVTKGELHELQTAIQGVLVGSSDEESIEVSCSGCQQRFKAVKGLAGHSLTCPSCGRAITIPRSPESDVVVLEQGGREGADPHGLNDVYEEVGGVSPSSRHHRPFSRSQNSSRATSSPSTLRQLFSSFNDADAFAGIVGRMMSRESWTFFVIVPLAILPATGIGICLLRGHTAHWLPVSARITDLKVRVIDWYIVEGDDRDPLTGNRLTQRYRKWERFGNEDVVGVETSYVGEVSYDYIVAERPYSGRSSINTTSRIHDGDAITVYCDPADPGSARLKVRNTWGYGIATVAGALGISLISVGLGCVRLRIRNA